MNKLLKKIEPKVSIIVPSYNADEFLSEALESVFIQTWTDYEVIVVDDGSTDATGEIIASYGDKIIYLRQDHKGVAAARNRGISHALGEYIAFLDADDLWEPTKLEKQIAAFERRPELGMVFTGNSFFSEGGIPFEPYDKRKHIMTGDVVKNIFLHDGVGTPTVMVPKAVFEEVGLFDEELTMAEDDNMWIRIAARYPVELIDELLVRVRDHPDRSVRRRKELYDMIEKNVHLLLSRDSVVRDRLSSVVPRKLAQLRSAVGYYYFEEGDYRQARREFARNIRSHKGSLSAYKYYLATWFPRRVIKVLAAVKQKLRKQGRG